MAKNPVTRKMITKAEEKLRTAQREFYDLVENCTHELRTLSKEELKDKWMTVGAYCQVCGKRFGWRCKNSPDSVCHYYADEIDTGEDGEPIYGVPLITGEYADVPDDYDPDNESDDWCIFCGDPEERK